MERLLYYMHVPWQWIKQRPHFIAEGLSSRFEVDLIYERPFLKNKLVNNPVPLDTDLHIKRLNRLPFNKNRLIRALNGKIIAFQTDRLLEKYDYIWVTHPRCYKFLKKKITDRNIVIYDCMDDLLEFPQFSSSSMREKIIDSEKELIERSDIVFASSEHLMKKLKKRYNLENVRVIFNALSSELGKKLVEIPKEYCSETKISYIGTVSQWIDIELILKASEKFKDKEFHFYGPIDIKRPNKENIFFHGPIEYEEITDIIKKTDVLIMPFLITELIKSVDPVKLYEYIASGKKVVVPYYDELKKFEDYVFFYKNKDEFIEALENKRNKSFNRKEFVEKNTWNVRVGQIIDCMEKLK